MRIAYTAGIDGTIVVPAYQHLAKADAIIGSAHPNHFINASGDSSNEVKVVLKNCLDKKHRYITVEVKIIVLCFQRTLPGMCPCLYLYD